MQWLSPPPLTLNIGGKLMELNTPKVMGIINITPDSFFEGSRAFYEETIKKRTLQLIAEGADIIDIGAYSSRPGAVHISEEEEMGRLDTAIPWIKSVAPTTVLSVDTFRSNIARKCVETYGVQIINDISGGGVDPKMFETIASLQVAYILMHMRGTPQTMQEYTSYDFLFKEVMCYFVEKKMELAKLGVKDIIIDPGFGFSKTLEQNYELLKNLDAFHTLNLPLLVGVSRKSMIFKLLDTKPTEALNGTTVLNTLALCNGCHILRVHDVKEAKESIKLYDALLTQKP